MNVESAGGNSLKHFSLPLRINLSLENTMSSNNFQNEVGDLLKSRYKIAHRIHDSPNRYGGYEVSQKPYDFFGATKLGLLWGAEAKRVKSTNFPFRNISEHQAESLLELGDYGWLFINWRTKKFGGRTGCAIWIPYYEFFHMYQEQIDKQSVGPADFPDIWFLHRMAGGWVVPEKHPLFDK